MHFGGLADDRKDSTATHITLRPQLGGHRQCGLAICTFHLGFSLEVLCADGRLKFLMSDWNKADGDEFATIIGQILGAEAPPRVVDLSGVPNEVAGVASAVIARTLFNLKVWQTEEERSTDPVLLVCEEAHRYVPNSGEAQYEAAQESIRRIAKEGRKYGVGLFLVSQRPLSSLSLFPGAVDKLAAVGVGHHGPPEGVVHLLEGRPAVPVGKGGMARLVGDAVSCGPV